MSTRAINEANSDFEFVNIYKAVGKRLIAICPMSNRAHAHMHVCGFTLGEGAEYADRTEGDEIR